MTATVTYLSLMNVFDDIQVVLGNPDGISEKKQMPGCLIFFVRQMKRFFFLTNFAEPSLSPITFDRFY